MAKNGCKIQKNNKNGKINKVLDEAGNESTLFQQIFNTPVLSLDEAINVYKNVYSDKFKPVEVAQDIVENYPLVEVQISDAKVEMTAPNFITASQMKKVETSEKMMELKEKQDGLKKRFKELEKLNNCLWS